MKEVKVQDAVGHVLCHDMTEIIPGGTKGPRFLKGHTVTAADIPVLLAMGKAHLFVWDCPPGMCHEDEGAAQLAALCRGEHMALSPPKEGKIQLTATAAGLLTVDVAALNRVNAVGGLMVATRHTNTAVVPGDVLCATRVIPLVIAQEILDKAKAAAGTEPLLALTPYRLKTAAIIATGSEIQAEIIADAFTPVVEEKLRAYGISVCYKATPGDDRGAITAAILEAKAGGAQLILATGGMSVDPDDRTPGAIADTGVTVVSYGAPVLPGAMLLLGYFHDGTPVLGLPGCVMYAGATVFDLILPRLAAGVPIASHDLAGMGHGGLCLNCPHCHYPNCGFGKGG